MTEEAKRRGKPRHHLHNPVRCIIKAERVRMTRGQSESLAELKGFSSVLFHGQN